MKPIAQTFYINEPDNGAPGVYLTSVELFFQSKSATYGVEVQIRPTENGNPTTSVMPFGSVKLPSSSINVSPTDAKTGTRFTFTSPIFLQTATSYAIVIIPAGGNPDYNIWTAELGGNDVSTSTPIKTNNDTGTLFLSSNDIQFTSIMTEDIKFNIYVADFTKGEKTTPAGVAAFTSRNSDYLLVQDLNGNFSQKEYVVVSNAHYNLAKLTYGSGTLIGTFIAGDEVYQTDNNLRTGKKTVTGNLFAAPDTANRVLKISNVVNISTGFQSGKQLFGSTSSKVIGSIIDPVVDSVITSATTNNVSVPFTDAFSVNHMIYVGQNERAYVQPITIVSIPNSSNLVLSNAITFTESNAIIGRIRGDGALHAKVEITENITNTNRVQLTLGEVTATDTPNSFANSKGQFLIGAYSGASANVISTIDSSYNTIVPQFASSIPPETAVSWSFTGTSFGKRVADSSPTKLTNNIEKELYDYPRILMSRSNEYYRNHGVPSTFVYASLASANGLVSPIIDTAKTVVDVVGYAITTKEQLSGYRLGLDRKTNNIDTNLPANTDNHNFMIGDRVVQRNLYTNDAGTETATRLGGADVSFTTDNEIIITNVSGFFSQRANVSIMLSTDYNNNSSIVSSSYFSEDNNNNLKYASRYISKSVVLAEGQDAEDIRLYLTAYRPAGTDLLVYARIMHKEDPGAFDNKAWSLLEQITDPSLLSSSANKDDFVEIQYGFPKAKVITDSGVRVSVPVTRQFNGSLAVDTNTDRITLNNLDDLNAGDRIRYFSNSATNFLEVGGLVSNNYYYVKTKGLTTKTFNGSSAVNSTSKSITISSNPFLDGDRIKYTTTSTAVYPLVSGNWYYVVNNTRTSTTIQLTETLGGSAIAITRGSADTNHSLASEYISLSTDNIIENPSVATVDLTAGGSNDNSHYIIGDDWITVSDLSNVSPQDFVYFTDATTNSNQFFIAQVQRKSKTNKRNVNLITPPGVTQWPPFSIANASFGVIKGLQWATAAFVYPDNNNIVRYVSGATNGSLSVYDGYKSFAIKIVPVSTSTAIVPRVKDMRAIALQV
jgi:hypothetical protein